jgi:predicted nucleotidyltransferase
MENLPETVKHYFNEFEDIIWIVSRKQNSSFLQDMLIDILYTISSQLNKWIHNTNNEGIVLEKKV